MRPMASPRLDMLTTRDGAAAARDGSSWWVSSAGPKKLTARVNCFIVSADRHVDLATPLDHHTVLCAQTDMRMTPNNAGMYTPRCHHA